MLPPDINDDTGIDTISKVSLKELRQLGFTYETKNNFVLQKEKMPASETGISFRNFQQ
jgi:hypothetical protein